MNFHEYRQSRRRTMSGELVEKEAITNATFGLAGEAGEIADLIKKMFFHGKDINETRAKLLLEFGDLLFYLDWLSDLAGFTLEEIAIANKIKLERRFPNGWNPEDAAAKRDEQ